MIKIRVAHEKDWDQIKGMMLDLHKFESQYDPRYSVDNQTKEILGKWVRSELKQKKGIILVAEDKRRLAGFVCGWIDEKPDHLYKQKTIGYLCSLFVKEKYRGKSVGIQLSEAILDFFREQKVKFVTVETHIQNAASQKLYKSLGFEDNTINLLVDLK